MAGPGGHEVRKARPALAIIEQGFDLFLRRVWIGHEETYTVGDTGVGACVWGPPGTCKIGAAKQLSMLPAMVGAFGRWRPAPRATGRCMNAIASR